MYNISTRRGLCIALSIIFLTFTIKDVEAVNVDDLKAYLGMAVEKRELNMIKVDIDDSTSSNSEVTKEENTEEIIDELEFGLGRLEEKYEEGIRGGLRAIKLVEILEVIRDIKDDVERYKRDKGFKGSTDIDSLISSSESYRYDMLMERDIESYEYNIGSIGDTAISPVDKVLKLVAPYGYKIDNEGEPQEFNNYISLMAPYNHEILSQWNGKVIYIEDDEEVEGLSVVTILHGQGLYTIYHHIEPGRIYVGKEVIQSEVIGTAGNTKILEPNGDNHIKYQIILDGVGINPIFIFGSRSKQMYEDWAKRSTDIYTVEEGEEFYYIESMSGDNPNKNIEGVNTIEGAVEVIGDYKRPDPGVLR